MPQPDAPTPKTPRIRQVDVKAAPTVSLAPAPFPGLKARLNPPLTVPRGR